MTKKIPVVNFNETPEIVELQPIEEAAVDEQPNEIEPPPSPIEEPDGKGADDIDTDELEDMLKDLKQIKKQNKMPPKKRVRKVRVEVPVEADPEPIEEAPVVVEEIVVATPKPKRKYTRKVLESPEKTPAPADLGDVPNEPVKKTAGAMIEEMQRAERALRYQMRKNKMQTLVSQAF